MICHHVLVRLTESKYGRVWRLRTGRLRFRKNWRSASWTPPPCITSSPTAYWERTSVHLHWSSNQVWLFCTGTLIFLWFLFKDLKIAQLPQVWITSFLYRLCFSKILKYYTVQWFIFLVNSFLSYKNLIHMKCSIYIKHYFLEYFKFLMVSFPS